MAAPLSLLVAQVLDPTPSGAEAAELLVTADVDAGRWVSSNLVFVVAAFLLALGAPAFVRLVPGRGSRFALPGVVLLMVGATGLAAWAASNLALHGLATADAPPRFAEAIRGDTASSAVEAVWIVGLLVGFVLVAIALLRSRPVPIWSPILILAFVVIEMALVGTNVAETIGFAALCLGVAAAAAASFRRS